MHFAKAPKGGKLANVDEKTLQRSTTRRQALSESAVLALGTLCDTTQHT